MDNVKKEIRKVPKLASFFGSVQNTCRCWRLKIHSNLQVFGTIEFQNGLHCLAVAY